MGIEAVSDENITVSFGFRSDASEPVISPRKIPGRLRIKASDSIS
jgi:hypothetical protein